MEPRAPELCVALDGTDRDWIVTTAAALAPEVHWLKVGLEAFVAHGPDIVRELTATGSRIFLDLKLHDIPATVRRAAANVARCGAHMVTVHAGGGPEMVTAAVEGAAESGSGEAPLVVAVTVLTSLDSVVMADLGFALTANEIVVRWAEMALRCGADGVVASPQEAALVRQAVSRGALIVTPGIRTADQPRDDQRRTATPAEAVTQGADLLVVGRPITRARSPIEAAQRILAEMATVRDRGDPATGDR